MKASTSRTYIALLGIIGGFEMARLFGTDGVRGVVNKSLTPELAYHLGRAVAAYFGEKKERPRFLIGRDTRISGSMLENAIAAGINSVGGDAVIAGVVPTPAIAYLVRKHSYDAGVMISASHNPYQDNGIKFFDQDGFKLPDAVEDELERLVHLSDQNELPRPVGAGIGCTNYCKGLRHEYVDFVCSTVDVDLSGMRVIYDGANGAAYQVGPEILARLGAVLLPTHVLPDGININANCGSTHLDSLKSAVVANNAAVGIANDGDADRCLLVDENGNALDGDQIMLLCALYLKQKGKLKDDMIVSTVMSNIGFHKAVEENGMKTVVTGVGDRYVLEKMREEGYSLGGEQSGHVIFLDYNSTGDGMLTAVQTLAIMRESGKTLSKLAAIMTKYPQVLNNVRVTTKAGWETNPLILAAIAEAEEELGESGRILVRASGTEPLIRVMAEGPNQNDLERICQTVADCIAREQGTVE